MGMAITKQQVKTFSTGAIVIGLVLLPGLASFIQQQLMQRKMAKLNSITRPQAAKPSRLSEMGINPKSASCRSPT